MHSMPYRRACYARHPTRIKLHHFFGVAGGDDQLDRAIAEIVKELKEKEKTLPPLPPYPKK